MIFNTYIRLLLVQRFSSRASVDTLLLLGYHAKVRLQVTQYPGNTHLPFCRYSAKRFCVAVALSTIRHIKLNHVFAISQGRDPCLPERVLAGRASLLQDACDPNESLRLRLVWSSGEGMVSFSFREEDQPEFADGALPCVKPRDASGSDVRSLRIMCICG